MAIQLFYLVKLENTEYKKLSLYERKRVKIDDNDKLKFYIGLDLNMVSSFSKLFNFDFTFDDLLIQNDFDCDETDTCKTIDTKIKNGVYKNAKYDYYECETLVSFYRISPAEISDNNSEAYSIVPFRYFVKNLNKFPNVFGIAPNSKTWNFWESIFYFKDSVFNVTYSNYPSHRFLRFYSDITSDDLLMQVSKTDEFYNFKGFMRIGNTRHSVNVCVDSSEDTYFNSNLKINQLIRTEICKNPENCLFKDDLKSYINDPYIDIIFDFLIQKKPNMANSENKPDKETHVDELERVSSVIQLEKFELVTLSSNKYLMFNFNTNVSEKLAKCDLVLQNRVFRQYYFLISNDLKNEKSIRAGFRKIEWTDFVLLDLWKYILVLFMSSLVVFAGIYIGSVFFKTSETGEKDSVYKTFD